MKFLLLKDHWVTSDPKIISRTENTNTKTEN